MNTGPLCKVSQCKVEAQLLRKEAKVRSVQMTYPRPWNLLATVAFMVLALSLLMGARPLQAASGTQMQDVSPESSCCSGEGDKDMRHMMAKMDGMSMKKMMSMMGRDPDMWSMMGSGKTGSSMGGDIMHGSGMGGGVMGSSPRGGDVMD